MAKNLPSPFKYRGKWRSSVSLPGGKRRVRDFERHDDARTWIAQTLGIAASATEHEAKLGGPTSATLAQALSYYATVFTVTKAGAAAELNRINHYRAAADMPPLHVETTCVGHRSVVEGTRKFVPSAFDKHNEGRKALRSETYSRIKQLANRRCNAISTGDLRELMTAMSKEGLSPSTIQKEIALLRHMFNVAVNEWNWLVFKNPCIGLKLGKSASRFVVLISEQVQALMKAASECDNPMVQVAVALALETALRKDSILSLDWSYINLETRTLQVKSKTGSVVHALSQTSAEILRRLPRRLSGRVFAISANALDMAWDGVRIKASLPKLQFRDLRHVAATRLARAGMTAPQLQRLLGHKTITMAQIYVNLAQTDMLEVLDRLAPLDPVLLIQPTQVEPEEEIRQRRSERIVNAIRSKAEQQLNAGPLIAEVQTPLPPLLQSRGAAEAHAHEAAGSLATGLSTEGGSASTAAIIEVDFRARRASNS